MGHNNSPFCTLIFVSIGFVIFWKKTTCSFLFEDKWWASCELPPDMFFPVGQQKINTCAVWDFFHIHFKKLFIWWRFSSQVADTRLKTSLFLKTWFRKSRRSKREKYISWLLQTCLCPLILNTVRFYHVISYFVKYEINLARWLRIFISSFYFIVWLSADAHVFN